LEDKGGFNPMILVILKRLGFSNKKTLDVINLIIKPLDVIILIIKHQQLGFGCSY